LQISRKSSTASLGNKRKTIGPVISPLTLSSDLKKPI